MEMQQAQKHVTKEHVTMICYNNQEPLYVVNLHILTTTPRAVQTKPATAAAAVNSSDLIDSAVGHDVSTAVVKSEGMC